MVNLLPERIPRDDFFDAQIAQGNALTYDDVTVRMRHSDVLPSQVDVTTRFSKNIPLKIPIASAAMDTVTNSGMAIALAKLGGIGIIHKNFDIETQRRELRRVKRNLSGIVESPVTVRENQTVQEVLNFKAQKKYSFDSFPVLNATGKIVGVVTKDDFKFCDNLAMLIGEIMSKEPLTAPSSISTDDAYTLMQQRRKSILPLINGTAEVVGMYTFEDLKRIKTGAFQMYNVDANGQLIVGAAIGTGPKELERAERVAKYADCFVIDTAHGDSSKVIDMVKELKSKYDKDVIAGNISEGSAALALAEAGADGIKVGQGPGSICTTRPVTGGGTPQISAVSSSERASRKYGAVIIADGGLEYSGDISKAIAAGAHCVMMGKMLAGTDESPGERVFHEGQYWKEYRGMGSLGAMLANEGSRQRYGQDGGNGKQLIPEGVEARVPYKGPLRNVIENYVGGLRSGMGYFGTPTIEDLRRDGNFWRISPAGAQESHTRVQRIVDPPNYQGR